MSRRIFVDAAAEMLRQAATYPSDTPMGQVRADLKALPVALQQVTTAMAEWAKKLSPSEQPLHPAISDSLFNVHQALIAATAMADAIGKKIESMHDNELRRLDNPRPNEQNWDYSRQ